MRWRKAKTARFPSDRGSIHAGAMKGFFLR